MLNRISPSILGVKDFKLFLNKLDSLKEKDLEVETIHIDVMDGEFVKNKNDMHTGFMIELGVRGYKPEVHLMVDDENLEKEIEKAIEYEATKIWIHVEVEDAEIYLNVIRKLDEKDDEAKVSIGLVINPDTDIDKVVLLKDKIGSVLVMSVYPGKGGQKFITKTYDKIKRLRAALGDIEIVVDGGINKSNVNKVIQAGADRVIIGKYLTGSLFHLKGRLNWFAKNTI